MSRTKSKVGIIGTGRIVNSVHLPVLLAIPEVSVDWIVDLDPSAAARTARSFGLTPINLPDDLTRLPDADVYLLTVPYSVRKPYYELLSARKAAVYVEKPFAKTLDDYEQICSAFAPNRLADGYQKRSWGPTAYLRRFVRSGIFGRLKAVRFEVGEPRTSTNRYAGGVRSGGGGLLMEIGCHGIDFFLHLVDAEEIALESGKMIAEDGYDLDTKGRFVVQSKTLGHIGFDVLVSSLRPTANRCFIEFESMEAEFSLFTWSGLHVKDRFGEASLVDRAQRCFPLTPYQNFYRHWLNFLRAVQTGETNDSSARASRLTAKALGQLYRTAGQDRD